MTDSPKNCYDNLVLPKDDSGRCVAGIFGAKNNKKNSSVDEIDERYRFSHAVVV